MAKLAISATTAPSGSTNRGDINGGFRTLGAIDVVAPVATRDQESFGSPYTRNQLRFAFFLTPPNAPSANARNKVCQPNGPGYVGRTIRPTGVIPKQNPYYDTQDKVIVQAKLLLSFACWKSALT